MVKYYDNSWRMKWNSFVLSLRIVQRKWTGKSTAFLLMGITTIPLLYFLLSSSILYPCTERMRTVRAAEQTEQDDDPFSSRPVTHAYDVSVKQMTSTLWTNGCPNERPQPLQNCSKARTKIVFVKTHKCASSTVSAAILRFALNKNLMAALPKYDLGHIGWPSPYRPFHVWGFSVAEFHDILAHHIVYDRCYVMHDFPKPQTIYTTIIRHPFQQFKSAVFFFNEERKILPKREEAATDFLLDPDKYEKDSRLLYGRLYFGQKSLTKNMMSTDLGYPPSQMDNKTSINIFVNRIDQDFELVMIQEYFDESLILLKRLMCWQLKDLIYMKLNQNSNNKYKKQEPTQEMLARHRQWSKVDYALYDHFNVSFWRKVEGHGDSFNRELDIFKHMVHEFNEFCSSRWMNGWVYPPNEFSKQFTMTKEDCRKLSLMPEHLTPTLWMVSNARLTSRRDNPFNTKALWTNQEGFDKWY